MRTAVLSIVVVLLAVAAVFLIRAESSREALLTGGAIIGVAVPWMVIARRQLGSAFSLTPQAKSLVTHGLYAKIPHPLYVFLDLALFGLIIALRQPWLLLAWGALIANQARVARRESLVLEQAFGDAYRDYRRSTWW